MVPIPPPLMAQSVLSDVGFLELDARHTSSAGDSWDSPKSTPFAWEPLEWPGIALI